MKNKKHQKANLENYSKLFAQMGLVLSLVIVYALLQNKTFSNDMVFNIEPGTITESDIPPLIEYKVEEVKKKIPKVKNTHIDNIKIDDTKDNIEPTIIFEDPEPVITYEGIPDEVDPLDDEPPIDDVSFIVLEDAPVFPGCEGTNEEKKKCFSKQINKFVNKRFDTGLAEELNLSSGVQRINTIFKIDRHGNIVNIQARSPHKKLQNEAIRVIKLLPAMEPGKQRGRAVTVSYSLPIVFRID